MDVERLVSFKKKKKKMKDGSTVINCQVEPKYIEDILSIISSSSLSSEKV